MVQAIGQSSTTGRLASVDVPRVSPTPILPKMARRFLRWRNKKIKQKPKNFFGLQLLCNLALSQTFFRLVVDTTSALSAAIVLASSRLHCSVFWLIGATVTEQDKVEVDERTVFYATVGQGISFWASMESSLVIVAAKLLGTTPQKTGLVLYSIINFYSWLSVIDELFLVETKYAAHKDEWGEISAKLRSLNDVRVRLAHHTLWDGSMDQGKPRLRPNSLDSRSKSKRHAPLNAQEILAFTEKVFKIEQRLDEFLKAMATTVSEPTSPFSNILLGATADPPPQASVQQHNSKNAE